MREQFRFLWQDWRRAVGRQPARWVTIWFYPICWALFWYRLERGIYLYTGNAYPWLRLPLLPFASLVYALANFDVPYSADVKGGLQVLHPVMGVVINGQAAAGYNLTLTGGNIIGLRGGPAGPFRLGDGVYLGANACIIGPVEIADRVIVGACACVVRSCTTEGATLVGVPAEVRQRAPRRRRSEIT